MSQNDRFIQLLQSTKRHGIESLIAPYLVSETDFFTAPASAKYHGSHEGGLVEHSLAVYDCFLKIVNSSQFDIAQDTAIIVCLLHDLCKANFYTVSTRNVKNEQTGAWEKIPYYGYDDKLPLGHGEKSVIILQQYIALSLDEVMAIRWHMGLSETDYSTRQSLSAAMNQFPIITALHAADLAACYFIKK